MRSVGSVQAFVGHLIVAFLAVSTPVELRALRGPPLARCGGSVTVMALKLTQSSTLELPQELFQACGSSGHHIVRPWALWSPSFGQAPTVARV